MKPDKEFGAGFHMT